MKKLIAVVSVLILIVLSGCIPLVPSSEKDIIWFSFSEDENGPGLPLDIDADITGNSINAAIPFTADINALIADFTVSGGTVTVNGVVQETGVTENNFSFPVVYKVTAEDGSSTEYTVTVDSDEKQEEDEILNISYGAHSRQKFDIYLPEDRYYHTPVIIFMHGGGWIGGSRGFFTSYCETYRDKGYAAATMGYRFTTDTPGPVTYIEIMDDIHSVIEYIADHSEEWKLSENFGLVGFSAGAVNAVLYPYGFDEEDYVKACVPFSAAYDMTDEQIREDCEDLMGSDIILMFTGAEENFEDASPVYHLKDVPTLIFHGKNDGYIYCQSVDAFADILDDNEITYSYIFYEDSGHGGYFLSSNTHYDEVITKIDNWFGEYLRD